MNVWCWPILSIDAVGSGSSDAANKAADGAAAGMEC